jgi:2-O-methyltransferase
MTREVIYNGVHNETNHVFQCSQCGHWALAPTGKTRCYVCEDTLEVMTAARLRQLIGRDDANILEIGANDGTDTVEFLRAFPTGQVMAFECEPRAIKKWRENVQSSRAVLIEAAIAEESGRRKFYPSGGKPPGDKWAHVESWDCSGSLLKDDQHTRECDWLTFGEPFWVNVWRLDSVLPFAGERIDLLWMDVQGAEAMVLRGGPKTIERTDWVFLECHQKAFYQGQATLPELVDLLPGFAIHSRWDGDNYLFRRVEVAK